MMNMPVNKNRSVDFTLTGDDISILMNHYEGVYEAKSNEYEQLGNELQELEKKIKYLKGSPPDTPLVSPINGYMKGWNWNQKIRYVLNKQGRMSRAGIIDEILKLEPERESEKTSIANSIGATLSTSVDKESAGYSRMDSHEGWLYFVK